MNIVRVLTVALGGPSCPQLGEELCSLASASQPLQQLLLIFSSFSFTAARDREREVLLLVMNFVLGGHHYKHCFNWRQQLLSIELNCHSMTI